MSKNNKYKGKQQPEPKLAEEHIVTIVSEHKKRAVGEPVPSGKKRVQAIVRYGSSKRLVTRHLNVPR